MTRPYSTISAALAAATPGSIVRIVGNNFADDNPANPPTLRNNIAYEIGYNRFGAPLADGFKMEVPRGVTVMIDAGAVFKLSGANIDVGSSTEGIDRSGGALQVLGTPYNRVYFTSYYDETVGNDTDPQRTTPRQGDWGGLVFRNDLDYQFIAAYNPASGQPARQVLEVEGIFLNYVNYADIRFGGGEVVVDGVRSVYSPIHLVEARPTVTFNVITNSAGAAISGDPNSFRDNWFQSWNRWSPFTADYGRVGPHIHNNVLVASYATSIGGTVALQRNSMNALAIRIDTPPGGEPEKLTTFARWDDWDIVHVVPENLFIAGTPGGPITRGKTVNILSAVNEYLIQVGGDGSRLVDGEFFALFDGTTRVVFEFDLDNRFVAGRHPIRYLTTDSAATLASKIAAAINEARTQRGLKVSATAVGSQIRLENFSPEWRVEGLGLTEARIDARLHVDPGMVVKLTGSRIEVEFGSQLIAEGRPGPREDSPGYRTVFTSIYDARYGAGGVFDTLALTVPRSPAPGDWGGIHFAPTSTGSLDFTVVAYGGGTTRIEGDFARFNPIEIYQSDVRITRSRFEFNDAVAEYSNRAGRGTTTPATIFIRGAQPIIVANDFLGNRGHVISVDVNALKAVNVPDWGRSTGPASVYIQYADNYGPMVRANRFGMVDNPALNNQFQGMEVRASTLTTESVWDDVDIVHIVRGEIVAPDYHHIGGIRLQSREAGSLVIKLSGSSAGFRATGRAREIDDRIGGILQIVGMPGRPVILTSLRDDSVGAGFDILGRPVFDTNADGPSQGQPGDWNGVIFDRYAHDRNVAVVIEREPAAGVSGDPNGTPLTSQRLGALAPNEKAGDDNLRLGFTVHGYIRSDDAKDVDVYQFDAEAGTEVWIDIDWTSFALDTIVELVTADGAVIARSDNSHEFRSFEHKTDPDGILLGLAMDRDVFNRRDFYSMNPRDAGMRVVLPGPVGQVRTYYVRVRSALAMGNINPAQIVEGMQFRLFDEDGRVVVFEFDRDGTVGSGAIPVRYQGATAAELAQNIVDAITQAASSRGLKVTGRVRFDYVLDSSGSWVQVPIVVVDGVRAEFDPGTSPLTRIANTSGAYQLQIRLREMQEIAGCTVQYADIRYPASGIIVRGMPQHSPLLGESAEAEGDNDAIGGAQYLGNLLTSDRNVISLAGYLSSRTDIDWYRIDVDLTGIQSIGGFNDLGSLWSTIFDIDYADGMARPDLSMWVFDSAGRLIYFGTNSNVADDRTLPVGPTLEDLFRGSVGARDPYIGPAFLPEGNRTFYVAVTSVLATPRVLSSVLGGTTLSGDDSAWSADPTAYPLVRVEPLPSVRRIVEEHIDGGPSSNVDVLNPNVSTTPSRDRTGDQRLALIPDEFQLGDVNFFVLTGTDLFIVNPFTGAVVSDLTDWTDDYLPGSPSIYYRDIAMTNDGRLTTVSIGSGANFNPRYREFDTGNANNLIVDVDTGINIYRLQAGSTTTVEEDPGRSVYVNAMVHDPRNTGAPGRRSRSVIVVGNIQPELPASELSRAGITNSRNLVWVLESSGTAINHPRINDGSQPSGARLFSNIVPIGWLDTTPYSGAEPATITGLAYLELPTVGNRLFAVDDQGNLYYITNELSANYDGGSWGFSPVSPSGGPNHMIYTGGGPQLNWITQVVNPTTGAPITFSGLAAGPRNVEHGRYAYTLFASDTAGNIWALDTEGRILGVFVNAQNSVNPPSPVGAIHGIDFSPIDYNLWHWTRRRGGDAGHGVYNTIDASRVAAEGYAPLRSGSDSYYFGLDDTGDGIPNEPQPGAANFTTGQGSDGSRVMTYNMPGGIWGSLTSGTFSLAGYSAADKPTLYFTYYAHTENSLDWDGLRVYISNDGATWRLVATNTDLNDGTLIRDRLEKPGYGGYIREIHDGGGTWRQARIDLSQFAGQSNLRLRFDFSTASDMEIGNLQLQGAYLTVVPAAELRDGQTMVMADNVTFEIDLGYALVLPNAAGAKIGDNPTGTQRGEWLTISDGTRTYTFEFDKNGVTGPGRTRVPITDSMTSRQVAEALARAINLAFGTTAPTPGRVYAYVPPDSIFQGANGNRVFLIGATSVSQGTDYPGAQPAIQIEGNAPGQYTSGRTPIYIRPDMDRLTVAQIVSSTINRRFRGSPAGSVPDRIYVPPEMTAASLNNTALSILGLDSRNVPRFAVIGFSTTLAFPQIVSVDTIRAQLPAGSTLDADYAVIVGLSGATTPQAIASRLASAINLLRSTYGWQVTASIGTDPLMVSLSGPQTIVTFVNGRYNNHPIPKTQTGVCPLLRFDPNETTVKLDERFLSSQPSSNNTGLSRVEPLIRVYQYGVTSPGPFRYSDVLEGDTTNKSYGSGNNANRFQNFRRGQNNAFEGWYIDDIIIGFAERGELVTNAPADVTAFDFLRQPRVDEGIVTAGSYQLEVRRAHEFGTLVGPPDSPYTVLRLDPQVDTNDRFVQEISIRIPPASELGHGDRFWIEDGVRRQEFVFLDNDLRGATGEAIPIFFSRYDSASTLAGRVASAINQAVSEGRLKVQVLQRSISDAVDLWGATYVGGILGGEQNPGTGVRQATAIAQLVNGSVEAVGTRYLRIEAPEGSSIEHRKTFRITDIDGNAVDFMFINQVTGETAPPGYYQITYLFGMPSTQIATLIRDAINRANSDGRLNVTASIEIPGRVDLSKKASEIVGLPHTSFFDSGSPGGETPEGVTYINPSKGGHPVIGDKNQLREKGYFIVDSTQVLYARDWGIRVEPAARDAGGNWPHPGSGRWMNAAYPQNIPGSMWVPGVALVNNIVAYSGQGGIYIAGDTAQPLAATPFVRVVNNTIVGNALRGQTPAGIGIDVGPNATPTLLNNIIAGWSIGIDVDATSSSTVIGGTAYARNSQNVRGATTGSFALLLTATEPLFVAPARNNFYPAAGSRIIDSSIDSLAERSGFYSAVLQPIGIPPSPILAPTLDIYGQLRQDDPRVSPPAGMGANVFKDRGAVDRVDFFGPTAAITGPEDNGALDRNPATHDVILAHVRVTEFVISLYDVGIGIDDTTVVPQAVRVYRDDRQTPLVSGVDYLFSYDVTNNRIILYPGPGIWEPGYRYTITLDRTLIQDLAGNTLQPNRPVADPVFGDCYFTVSIDVIDYGDAPDPSYPTRLVNNGGRHLILEGFFLGQGISRELAPRTADTFDDGVFFQYGGPIRVEKDVTRPQERHGIRVYVTVPQQWNAQPGQVVGYVNAWLDFNRDGDWEDSWPDGSEYILRNVPVTAGWNNFDLSTGYLVFNVPRAAQFGPTWARVRLTNYQFTPENALTFTGLADNGEVEDYQVELVEYYRDWADAPAPYRTTAADGGPYHVVWPALNPHLAFPDPVTGQVVGPDWEPDGQPHPEALGDDLDSVFGWVYGRVADENGAIIDKLNPNRVPRITVYVIGGGYLNAWIDINQDGDFDDTGEQIVRGLWLDHGEHRLHEIPGLLSMLPEDMPVGHTLVRLRLSSNVQYLTPYGGNELNPAGPAPNGEVEDYRVPVELVPIDYGDAPDPTYPSRAQNDGARHLIVDGFQLGWGVTRDRNATVDDQFDDGVVFQYGNEIRVETDPARPQEQYLVRVYVGVPAGWPVGPNGEVGYLNAWVDFNRDGDWDDPADQIFQNVAVRAGWNNVYFAVPRTASFGWTWTRFRLSSQPLPTTAGYLGEASDGEVEDYAVELVPFYRDWGDAPAPYRTLEAQNGAYHVIWPEGSPHLAFPDPVTGAIVAPDWEVDGQPHPQARGDDLGGWAADENGVRVVALAAGARPIMHVYAVGSGWLNVWIDLNADGDWDDAGEQVVQGLWLTPGEHRLHEYPQVAVLPADLTAGPSFMRVRFSGNVQNLLPYGGNPTPGGPDPNGEVEDHQVTLLVEPRDYGDAPNNRYPTSRERDGARHIVVPGFSLGANVDEELNARAVDNFDDGVAFQYWGEIRVERDPAYPAERHGVRVYVSVPTGWPVAPDGTAGYLNAWLDFNRDGDWDDTWTEGGEQIFRNVPVKAGWNNFDFDSGYLVFTVPRAAELGKTWARFRLTSAPIPAGPTPGYLGQASDGEVEDYEVTIVDYYRDYGDAPAQYPVTNAGGGAYHAVWPRNNPHLAFPDPNTGTFVGVDWYIDGQPDSGALGDDLDQVDDENGVRFWFLSPGYKPLIQIYAATPGYLNAWLDINRDGDWNDAGEQLASGVWVASPGLYWLHELTDLARLPADAPLGETFLRVRFSSNVQYLLPAGGNPNPAGPAPNGEVEDHRIEVRAPSVDFGDAPASYGTLLAADGARHLLVPTGVYLGSAPGDAEADGQPDSSALLDDWTNQPDEDALDFYGSVVRGELVLDRLIRGELGRFSILVTGQGYLGAWIDFNGDGVFADYVDGTTGQLIREFVVPGVYIADDTVPYVFDVHVPANAVIGSTVLRLRYSSDRQAVMSPVGPAPDGEVEDHLIFIDQVTGVIQGTKFQDSNANGIWELWPTEYRPLIQPAQPGSGSRILSNVADGSYGPIDLGFEFTYYGALYTQFYVSDNGTISFGSSVSSFDPAGFPENVPMIAPFWANADLRLNGGYVELIRGTNPISGNPFVQVNWVDVGFYNRYDPRNLPYLNRRNTFGLYLEDDPAGDIVAFIYNNLQWTTADYFAPGVGLVRTGGYGDPGAEIGFNAGNGYTFARVTRPTTQSDLDALVARQILGFRIDANTGRPAGVEYGLPGAVVYIDLNRNGQRDPGEPSVTSQSDLRATLPDESGQYQFTGLPPGTYILREDLTSPQWQEWINTYPWRGVVGYLAAGDLPVIAVPPTALADGAKFEIFDGRQRVVFEFDRNGVLTDPQAVAVSLVGLTTADEVAQAIANAVSTARTARDFLVSAAATGDEVILSGDPVVFVPRDYPWTVRFTVPGGAGIADGSIFAISDGVRRVVFEFDWNGAQANAGTTLIPVSGRSPTEVASTIASVVQATAAARGINMVAIAQGSEVIFRGRGLQVDRLTSFLPGGPVRINGDGSYTVNLQAGDVIRRLDFGNYLRPLLQWDGARVLEGNAGQFTEVTVNLTWLRSFGADVQVVVTTADGTATVADADYTPATEVLDLSARIPPRALWPTRTITSNTYGDYDYGISGTTLVYQVLDAPAAGNDWEIWLYDLAAGTLLRVTDNRLDDRFPAVYQDGDTSYVVWVGSDPAPGATDTEIFMRVYRSGVGFISPIIRLTNNAYDEFTPRIHDTLVTWVGQVTSSNSEIFVFNYRNWLDAAWGVVQPPRNVSNTPFSDFSPQTFGARVVWSGWDGLDEEIYVWSATTGTRAITRNSVNDRAPRIYGDIVVWEQFDGNDFEIWMYNLAADTSRRLTDNTTPDVSPAIWGQHIVWQGTVGSLRQIFYTSLQEIALGLSPVNISANPYDNQYPQIQGDRVVWHARIGTNFEVMVYDLTQTSVAQNISLNPATDWYPMVSGDTVVWRNWDGTDYEIIVAQYQSPRIVTPVRVTIVGDNRVESDEYFWLQMASAQVPALGLGSVTVPQSAVQIWILNDDDFGYGWDFGDAPASYRTTLADDGARHAVNPAVYLGRTVDAERDGRPSADALGDDLLNTADEDGVIFLTPLIPGQTAQIAVRASVAGYLDAWIDYNRNGRWGDPADPINRVEAGEQVFTSRALQPGVNILSFTVPSWASLGQTFARFRFSTTGGLLYVGAALDGEVEDYAVQLVAAAPTGVAQQGRTVYFYGTGAADRFEFTPTTSATGQHRVVFNGVEYRYAPADVEAFVFHGAAGVDTVVLNGTSGNETAELRSGFGMLSGANFLVTVHTSENVTVNGRGGSDVARLSATAGVKDTVIGTSTYVQMTTGTVVNRVNNFSSVFIAGNPGESSDVVRLYGSASISETFVGRPTSIVLNGGGYRIQADNFRWAYAYGNGAGDKAELYDNAATRDWVVADPTYARISGSGFYVYARSFADVVAFASTGNDGATLYDNAGGVDTFTAEPGRAELAGSGYRIELRNFRYVTAQSSGGADIATLYDNPATYDRFEATSEYGVYYGSNFNNRAFGFRTVRAISRGGDDRARLYDSASLTESFLAYPTYARLIGVSYERQAEGFRYVTAYSSGGGDQAFFYDSAGNDTFVARPFEGRMTGAGYDNQAIGFRRIVGNATAGGFDLAQLYDMALAWAGDHLQAQANWAKVSNAMVDYELWAIDFDKVEAYGSDVGVDTKEIVGALDFALERFGSWS
ncbi:MAG: GEVED domain-containing protein [Thermoguttaceae bacterium]|nr:GEVED domain-containing protein [Thermoguttaceae bacterium]